MVRWGSGAFVAVAGLAGFAGLSGCGGATEEGEGRTPQQVLAEDGDDRCGAICEKTTCVPDGSPTECVENCLGWIEDALGHDCSEAMLSALDCHDANTCDAIVDGDACKPAGVLLRACMGEEDGVSMDVAAPANVIDADVGD